MYARNASAGCCTRFLSTWAYTMSYLLGLVSRFDSAGQMAALGGFASKMGLASGPAIAAAILGDNNYPLVIGVAVFALMAALMAIAYPTRVQDRKAGNVA